LAKPLISMDGRKHGIGGYNFGCRCDVCKEAKATKRKEYQSSKSWQYQRTYLQRMKESNPEKYRAWLNKNNEYKKKSFQKDPEKSRWQTIHKKYKLTKQMYLELMQSQNGLCAICKQPPNRNWLAVDHDHKCCPGTKTCGNCIRGLLCSSCNSFLGRVNDNLESAIEYLTKKEGDALC